MSGSFFGFDATIPPLNSDQLTGLDSNGVSKHQDETEEEELERKIKNFSLEPGEEFVDFDYEQNFDLGTQLEESGDDMNEETFGGVVDVGVFFYTLYLSNFFSLIEVDRVKTLQRYFDLNNYRVVE